MLQNRRPDVPHKLVEGQGSVSHQEDEIPIDVTLASPAAEPERMPVPDKSTRTEWACAYRWPIPAQSRFRRCTPPSHAPRTGDESLLRLDRVVSRRASMPR